MFKLGVASKKSRDYARIMFNNTSCIALEFTF